MKVQIKLGFALASLGVACLAAAQVAAQSESARAPLVRPIGTATSTSLELAVPIPAPEPNIAATVSLTYDPGVEPATQALGVAITAGANFAVNTYELFIENDIGILVSVGVLEWDGSNEEVGEFSIDQEDPGFDAFLALLGVDDVGALQQRLLEVRANGVTVVLLGAVPILGSNTLSGFVDPETLPVGFVELRHRGADHSVYLRIQNVRVLDAAYYLFVETSVGSDLYEYVANLEPVDRQPTILSDEIEYRVHTRRGQELPLQVATVADLVGRHLMILDDDLEEVVGGDFPTLRGRGSPGGKIKVSAPLVRPTSLVADSTAFGSILLSRDLVGGGEKIEFRVSLRMQANFLAGEGRVFVELIPGARVFNEIGSLFDVRSQGRVRARVLIDTSSGEPLPLGERALANLAGREVQIRDPGGYLYLRGLIPALPAPGVKPAKKRGLEALANVDPVHYPRAEARVALRYDGRRNEVTLNLRVQRLPRNETFEVWFWDARLGAYARTFNLFSPSSRATVIRTRRGAPLPLGILDIDDLAGLQMRILSASGGGIVFEGALPNF